LRALDEEIFPFYEVLVVMRISHCLTVIALVTLPAFGLAQEKPKDYFWLIAKWTPSSLLTPQTPTMQLGAELLFPKFAGLSLEFDYGLPFAIINHYPGLASTDERYDMDPPNLYHKKYSKSRFELRKYFAPGINGFAWFVGVESFHISYSFLQTQGEYVTRNDGYYFDGAHGSKNINGFSLNMGLVYRSKSPLSFEFFFGSGLRKRDLTYSDVVNQRSQNSREVLGPMIGEQLLPHLSGGIKVGYRIVSW
jgi:hypothetical protein